METPRLPGAMNCVDLIVARISTRRYLSESPAQNGHPSSPALRWKPHTLVCCE